MPHPILDQPDILRTIFHPRPDYPSTAAAPVGRPLSVQVEPGVTVGARLHAAGRDAPAILYWHGNGEIAADYDAIAPLYTRMGIALLIFDYRGYGSSDGTPTCSNLLSDAVAASLSSEETFRDHGLAPSRLYAMGRSLGSAAAIEVVARDGKEFSGLIVESGFADTFALLSRLGVRSQGTTEGEDGFGNPQKIAEVTIPTLIIHGVDDVLIPLRDGEELFRRAGAEDKRLVSIAGAGHNDLMLVGQTEYFDAIQEFIRGELEG